MSWKPITEEMIWDEILRGCERMTPTQERLYDAIKILPTKWSLEKWGEEGGGFWVVALYGNQVIWYNDIEHGFNRSRYTKFGEIDEYWCDQSSLNEVIVLLEGEIREGFLPHPQMSPPIPGSHLD